MEYPAGWKAEQNSLTKTFEKENFVSAVAFLNKIVPLAEQMDHHPDMEVFSYKKVRIKLTTHDAGNKITEKDIKMAQKINSL